MAAVVCVEEVGGMEAAAAAVLAGMDGAAAAGVPLLLSNNEAGATDFVSSFASTFANAVAEGRAAAEMGTGGAMTIGAVAAALSAAVHRCTGKYGSVPSRGTAHSVQHNNSL